MTRRPTKTSDPVTDDLLHLYTQLDAIVGDISRSMGITPQQAMLLCATDDIGSPSMQELASKLGCDKSNVTGLVNRIEERNLIRRVTDPEDGRITRITTTADGRRLLDQLRKLLVDTLGESIDDVDAKRLRALTSQITGWRQGS